MCFWSQLTKPVFGAAISDFRGVVGVIDTHRHVPTRRHPPPPLQFVPPPWALVDCRYFKLARKDADRTAPPRVCHRQEGSFWRTPFRIALEDHTLSLLREKAVLARTTRQVGKHKRGIVRSGRRKAAQQVRRPLHRARLGWHSLAPRRRSLRDLAPSSIWGPFSASISSRIGASLSWSASSRTSTRRASS